MTFGGHFLVPKNAWLMSTNARTFVPDKTHCTEGPGNRYVWPITALPDKTLHWGRALETEVCMTDHSTTWQDTALREGPGNRGMYVHWGLWKQRYVCALRALETEVCMTNHSSTWPCGSLEVYWSLSPITLCLVNTQHGLAWSLWWSVHPLSDWLCSCLTCINYWAEYASFDWLWGLCLTCKSKTKENTGWSMHPLSDWLCLCLTCTTHWPLSDWLWGLCTNYWLERASFVSLVWRFVSHMYKLLAGACIVVWLRKKPKHCRKSPPENCTSTFQVPKS